MSHKLYVLVDRTLTQSQQAVQACHAVAEFAKAHPDWQHQSLVLIGLDGQGVMEFWDWRLKDYKKAVFRESFWDNRLTAIACYGCDDVVKNLKLL